MIANLDLTGYRCVYSDSWSYPTGGGVFPLLHESGISTTPALVILQITSGQIEYGFNNNGSGFLLAPDMNGNAGMVVITGGDAISQMYLDGSGGESIQRAFFIRA